MAEVQECQPCDKGQECTTPPCTICTPCAPGFFKASVGTDGCTACPINTYRQDPGANELSNCEACLEKSTTRGLEAQTTWQACLCQTEFYRVKFDDPQDACMDCPVGLICHGDDTLEVVVPDSTWVKDDDIYRLLNCPVGYAVAPAADEPFNAAIQRCEPCGKGFECVNPPCTICTACAPGFFKAAVGTDACTSCPINTYREDPGANELSNCEACLEKSTTRGLEAQTTWESCICDSVYYRIKFDDSTDQCQDCPPGLICHGDDTLEVVVAGSNWIKDDAIFRLVDCPAGYYVFNGGEFFSSETQRCEPCEAGFECVYPPCTACSQCAPGYYKAVKGPIPCSPCPANTYRELSGATDLGNCLECPEGADTRGQEAQTSFEACICGESFYMSGLSCSLCPVGAACNFGRT